MTDDFAHSISLSKSRTISLPVSKPAARVARATIGNLLSNTRHGRSPAIWGQKYCSWRIAAEWNVRACTPPMPMAVRRSRISPAARLVNVTASTRLGATWPRSIKLAMR